MKLLIVCEHNNQLFKTANANTLTAAKQLSDDIDLLIVGYQCQSVVEAAKHYAEFKKILVADHETYAHQLAENVSELIAELAKDYQYILAADTSFGKDSLPRVAALLNVGMIADVITIESKDTFVRPIYAGNALTHVQSHDAIKVLSIRSTAFIATVATENTQPTTELINKLFTNDLCVWIKDELHVSSRPELGDAAIVVSGGRGLKSAENFKLLEAIADKLGAAIGASRAAVDAGFAPNDLQVGQTGKVVAPKLYIAIGISGAIQHLAGMKDSKVIVAINNDPDAPIFQVADYGLVADLFTSITELQQELDKVY
jgi:electron transfer flavoprotein alpha subunit